MLVYKDYTEGDIDCYPMYTYSIYEGEEIIGRLFLVLESSYELRVEIVFPCELEDWPDLKAKHTREIMQLIENHMIIDEPYMKIEYNIVRLALD